MNYNRFKWKTSPLSLTENIIISGNVRFTLLTDRLIRIEYDKNAVFEDRASQMAFNRNFPAVNFTKSISDNNLIIATQYLKISYSLGEELCKDSLCIKLRETPATCWRYGEKSAQLKGTACTLDNVNGEIDLEDGVCSRNGFAVIDDSNSLLLTENGWFDVRNEETSDIYFFGYGHSYSDCIRDFYMLTGEPQMLPDYAFGNWWSRYHKYTQQRYCELMERFKNENIPFSVAVVDMDWHRLDTPKEAYIDDKRFWIGWTGYSWNKELFPDYREFLKTLKEYGLKTALNLHPSNGVGCHEDMYSEMATACGIDPESKKLVKLDLLNPDFMEKYFDILHHPYEKDGVDFWWMDWQQGNDYWWVHDEEHPENKLEGMSPLWLLNHLHILDITRNGKRPMFFSRYCGLGAHRYPVGFSGDTIATWESLDFQPFFTANASNAGYCWWSHDIGGHMQGYRDDEMQIRWLQLGVLSPINRLHSTNDPFAGKEPWNLNKTACNIAEEWLRNRHRLFPYIYTMNYRTANELKPIIQPMYYIYPECDEAYEMKNQYWFGSEFFVAPITEKNDRNSLLGGVDVWLPEGRWFDFFSGLVYSGSKKLRVHRTLEEYPIFAKSGAIIPTEVYTGDNSLGKKENIKLYVFPGADNVFNMYEDSGDGNQYKNGDFVTTEFSLKWGNDALFIINPAKGNVSLLPQKRSWSICFRGFAKDINTEVSIGGESVKADLSYDSYTNTTEVTIKDVPVSERICIKITAESLITDNSSANDRAFDIIMHSQIGYGVKTALWDAFCANKKFLYTVCPSNEDKEVLSAVEEMKYLKSK